MMIQVNLLPARTAGRAGGRAGRGSKRGSGGASLAALRAPFDRALATVKDPFLLGAVAAVALAVGAVGFLHVTQARAETEWTARESQAIDDSTRYAQVIADRRRAVAQRDSLWRQLAIVSAIDSNRYVWAHVLDEVSQALPAYTWLVSVQQTSAAPPPPSSAKDSTATKAVANGPAPKDGKPAADSAAAPRTTRFRLVGQTVDIQALTLFMRDLEASPFLQNVQLARSEAVAVDGKDVTEFTLDGEFQVPARAALRTETITMPVR